MTTNQRDVWVQVLTGASLGDYEVKGFKGGGGFGLVFEAEDKNSGKAVALKVLEPGSPAGAALEFEDEGKLLDQLDGCRHVVDLHESSADTFPLSTGLVTVDLPIQFHVLELASGCLDETLGDLDSIEWPMRLHLWRDAVLGVHQMHLKKIVHRDLKTANCLLFVRPRARTISKIGDLGRSRDLKQAARLDPQFYLTGRGDYRFAPPEFLFWQGDETPAAHRCADLYGLGSLLFELATGQGITSYALGFGPDIVQKALRDFQAGHALDLSSLRSHYAPAFEAFDAEVPSAIKLQAGRLIRQLCDPVPESRLPKVAVGRRRHRSDGLEWLLRQADILLKILPVAMPSGSAALKRGA